MIRTAEIFSFFGDTGGTLPRFSGMAVLAFALCKTSRSWKIHRRRPGWGAIGPLECR